MRRKLGLASLVLGALVVVPSTAKAQSAPWTVEVAIFGLLAGMSGEVTVGANTADLDLSFDEVLENLELGAMGSVRIGRGRWALTTEVILHGAGRRERQCECGRRSIEGPFGRDPSGTVDWFDPFVGARLTLPVNHELNANFRGDIGGFWVGSKLAWQAYPYVSWSISKRTSLEGGYRWISLDYEQGSGAEVFRYDVVSQGPQRGLTLRF